MPTSSVRHLAIIMDGNRRWAKERGLPSLEGHRAGYERLKEIADACLDRGIEILTVFAFSTENWKRTEEEVGYLMNLMEQALTKELGSFTQRGVRLKIIGRREGLRPSIVDAIEHLEQESAENTRGTLCICFNYGGRAEIVDACKRLVARGVTTEEIDEEMLQHEMYWPEMPDPDVIVRTSGEERLSGFLLWQSAYSELYWTKKHWPDFDVEELEKAMNEFERRGRRFGA